MKRRLAILNLLLCALIAAAGWQLRRASLESGEREHRMRKLPAKAATPPSLPPAKEVQPLAAAAYSDIAQRMLFTKDRNPTVVVEVVTPKPMPPLPVAFGVIQFADGPTVIMKEKPGAPERGIRPGEQIGEFTLISASSEEVALEWNGEKITKKLADLAERGEQAATPVATVQPAVGAAPAASPGATPAPPQAAGVNATSVGQSGAFGVDLSGGNRACQQTDASPGGTVKDGMKKVVAVTPFGTSCRWEPVK